MHYIIQIIQFILNIKLVIPDKKAVFINCICIFKAAKNFIIKPFYNFFSCKIACNNWSGINICLS